MREIPRGEDTVDVDLRVAGAERVLYACEGVPPSVLDETALDERAKEAIAHRNAAALLGLGGSGGPGRDPS